MIADKILLGTDPLVAMLRRDDRHHQQCVEAIEPFNGLLLSTEAVLTEAMHLLGERPGGQQACLEMFIRAAAILVPVTRVSLQRCKILMVQYGDVPMDFPDATLVALAEETGIRDVFTLDRNGFQGYRMGKRETFRMLPA